MPIIDPSFFEYSFICRVAGLIGFLLYVTSFLCLSTGRIDSSRPTYFALVLTAALLVMLSLTSDFNLSAALIQGFYIAISLGGIFLRLRAKRRAAQAVKAGPIPAFIH